MSGSEEKSNRLKENSTGVPLGYYLSAQFHPHITLEKKRGYQFAATLSDYFDADACAFESTGWQLRSASQGLTIEVGKGHISLLGENPSGKPQEWYEHRYHDVLARFLENFQPQIALGSNAVIRQLFDVDGDSRDFLAQHVMDINPDRFVPLQRPIQLLGMRIAFPPYKIELEGEEDEKTTAQADWLLELKVESWLADPEKLFVEADATWPEPMKWDPHATTALVNRLQEITSYLSKVRDFLDHNTGGFEQQ